MVADNPHQQIPHKMFHAQIRHDLKAIQKEETEYMLLPKSIVNKKAIEDAFLRIKRDEKGIVEDEIDRILSTPGMSGMIVRKWQSAFSPYGTSPVLAHIFLSLALSVFEKSSE